MPTSPLALGLALVPVIAPAAQQPGVWQLHEEHVLGAPANFIVTARDEADARAAVSAARAEIERLNGIFDTRRPSSELSRLNSAGEMRVSPELFEVISLAEQVRAASAGAFNPLLGEVLGQWRRADGQIPDADLLSASACRAQAAVGLEPAALRVVRPRGARFDLDGIAKGYIVDRALAAGMAAAPINGMAVDIGGDMHCRGAAPGGPTWDVGLPDPAIGSALAPLVAEAHLKDRAIATSGRGPRDFVTADGVQSATLSPWTGQPQRANIAATVVAPSAAEADALTTALLVMPAHEGVNLAESWPGAQARITDMDGKVCATSGWGQLASEPPARLFHVAAANTPAADKWIADWAVQIIYQAPDKAVERRNPDFRTPYMAMWITDKDNNPVRTLVLVGTRADWQQDNYIWWSMYKNKAERLVALRSTSTALSGAYPTYWPGYNDDWKFMPQGEYVLHIETSREKGKHTYRTVPLHLGGKGFSLTVPSTEEGGGLKLTYGKRE